MDEDILSNLGLGVDGAEPDQEDTQPQDTIDIDNTERYKYNKNYFILGRKEKFQLTFLLDLLLHANYLKSIKT